MCPFWDFQKANVKSNFLVCFIRVWNSKFLVNKIDILSKRCGNVYSHCKTFYVLRSALFLAVSVYVYDGFHWAKYFI